MILLVDPDTIWQEIFESKLNSQNLILAKCRFGQEALDFLQNQKPRVVVLELDLPDMSGISLLRNIRGSKSFSVLPIIVLSRQSSLPVLKECLRYGVNNYLYKPEASQKDIFSTVSQYIDYQFI